MSVVSGTDEAGDPGELLSRHAWRLTPEFYDRLTKMLEMGLYVLTTHGLEVGTNLDGGTVRIFRIHRTSRSGGRLVLGHESGSWPNVAARLQVALECRDQGDTRPSNRPVAYNELVPLIVAHIESKSVLPEETCTP